MRRFFRIFFVVGLFILATQALFAQNASSALQALDAWKSGAVQKLNGQPLDTYRAVGVSVARLENGQVKTVFSVSVSQDVTKLGPLKFSAQPVRVMSTASGTILQVIGESSEIRTVDWEREDINDEIVASPAITSPISLQANAIKLNVFGLRSDDSKPFTIIMPLSSDVKSAALGSVGFTYQTAKLVEGKCIWYLGYCETGCGVLCIGCNDNSPQLNCANCTMSCANGQPCTPSTPRPVDCTGD